MSAPSTALLIALSYASSAVLVALGATWAALVGFAVGYALFAALLGAYALGRAAAPVQEEHRDA